jgi:hypothetical protein
VKRVKRFFGGRSGGSSKAPPIDPSADYAISQFDNVRVAITDETTYRGYAGRAGVCYGFTTPSVTNVPVVGGVENDVAFIVHFEEEGLEEAWFAPDLLELVDHGAGTAISIGEKSFLRREDGEWEALDAGDSD